MAHTTTRRTQAERTAETRLALLDAAVDCLVELGYARTTTREVAARAGVSRGAQTHHFPEKRELVVAAVEHLFDQQAIRFTEGFRSLPEDQRTLVNAVDLLWQIASGPTYPAVLELVVAGRTDPELGAVVRGLAASLEATVSAILAEFFPDLAEGAHTSLLIDVAFTFVQGAAVSSYAGFGDPDTTLAVLRSLASLATPETMPLLLGALGTTAELADP